MANTLIDVGSFGHLAGQNFRFVQVYAGNELTRDDIDDPAFWEHHGSRLMLGDRIRVYSQDMTKYADCICTYKEGHSVAVTRIDWRILERPKVAGDAIADNYDVSYQTFGGKAGWYVRRAGDGSILSGPHAKQWQAMQFAEENWSAVGSGSRKQAGHAAPADVPPKPLPATAVKRAAPPKGKPVKRSG